MNNKFKRKIRIAVVFLAILSVSFICRAEELILVKDGQANSLIVISDEPSKIVDFAAEELKYYLKEASGADVPIVRESALTEDAQKEKNLILVGDSKLAASLGISGESLPLEGLLVKTKGEYLILLGQDKTLKVGDRIYDDPLRREVQPGTLYAVYAFLTKELDIRWLWPGVLGEVVPKKKTIAISEEINYTFQPKLKQRYLRPGLGSSWHRKAAREVGLDGAAYEKMKKDYQIWARRNGLGRRVLLRYGHAFTKWYDKYYAQHPDWFAMLPDGKRHIPPGYPHDRVKICTSNPEVIKKVLEDGKKFLDANPHYSSFSACPNDSAGYCMCPGCKALDDLHGEKIILPYRTGNIEYVSLSDRYATFWNTLAQELVKTHPDKYVFGYAYSHYRRPPLHTKIHKNVIVAYVGFHYLNKSYNEASREQWLGWARTGCHLYLRPNYLLAGHAFPINFARRMGSDIKMCAETGMLGTDFDSLLHHWATNGLNYYVLVSLLRDPDREVEDIIDDYCESGFGRAAPLIKRYFDHLEEVTDAMYEAGTSDFRREFLPQVTSFFTPEVIKECREILEEAMQVTSDEGVKRRIAFLAEGLTYTELQARALERVRRLSEKEGDINAALEAVSAREEFYKKHMTSWAINVVSLKSKENDRRYSGYFGGKLSEALAGKKVVASLAVWKFHTDPEKVGEERGWFEPGFDDSQWQELRAGLGYERQGFPDYFGVSWYRTRVRLPKKLAGKKITLRFGAIDESGWVYLNGRLIGQILYHPKDNPNTWFTPLVIDITGEAKLGAENTIAVKVENVAGQGGLWKPVTIQTIEGQ